MNQFFVVHNPDDNFVSVIISQEEANRWNTDLYLRNDVASVVKSMHNESIFKVVTEKQVVVDIWNTLGFWEFTGKC